MGCGSSTQPGAGASQRNSKAAKGVFTKPFLEKYQPTRKLANGGYSQVHLVKERSGGQTWAAKVIVKSEKPNEAGKMSMGAIALELQALRKVQGHDNVVKFWEFIDSTERCFMVCEHLNGPDLFDQIEMGTHYSEQMAADSVCALVDAMRHVHAAGFIHRDIKPENIVLRTPEGPPVIIDFGLAIPNKVFDGKQLGTPNFMAPEMIRGLKSNEKIDVWGMGVMVYTMLCGKLPFEDPRPDKNANHDNWDPLYQVICEGNVNFEDACWTKVENSAQSMIMAMLTVDPTQRPSFEELGQHTWLQTTSTKYAAKRQEPVMLDSHERIKELNCWRKKAWKQKSHAFIAIAKMSSLSLSNTGMTKSADASENRANSESGMDVAPSATLESATN